MEIVSYLCEALEVDTVPNELVNYVDTQVTEVYRGMWLEEHDPESHPLITDPITIEGDYYRASIAEFGSLYEDYPIDDDDD